MAVGSFPKRATTNLIERNWIFRWMKRRHAALTNNKAKLSDMAINQSDWNRAVPKSESVNRFPGRVCCLPRASKINQLNPVIWPERYPIIRHQGQSVNNRPFLVRHLVWEKAPQDWLISSFFNQIMYLSAYMATKNSLSCPSGTTHLLNYMPFY